MPHAVVYDLEYTAWPGSLETRWLRPGEFPEVVQIGAVRVDRATFAEVAAFEVLARPRINPVLSDYFVGLTGITNEAVGARGIDFRPAYDRFVEFANGDPIVAYGRDDAVLVRNLRLYGIARARALPPHTNIAPWFRAHGIDTRGRHACDMAAAAGAAFEGRRHDALEDARSVAQGVKTLIARGAPNPLAAAA